MNHLTTIPKARERVAAMAESQKACYQFEFTRSFEMVAGKSGTAQLPMATEGDFEQIEYNMWHNATGNDIPKVLFKNQVSSNAQASDFVPCRLIATPGSSGVRFGARQFWRFYPAKDTLAIQWDASECANNVKIEITFKGWIFPNYGAA